MNKRILSVLLCVCLLAALLPAGVRAADTLEITTAEEFLIFADNCRMDSYSLNLTVSLRADIDLGNAEFSPIPLFRGTFEGNGHTISGLLVTADGSNRGLFRYLTDTALVRDLTVRGDVIPGGSRTDVGGIVGSNAGKLINCSFVGHVSGSDRVGGIAGSNAVTGILENCRTEGSVHGSHFAGGIAGSNAGVIRGCTNAAAINTTPVQNTVDISDITVDTITGTEAVNTVTDIGGIAGSNSGVLRSCENLGDVGYRYMGYNVGGIAGSHTGYITKCSNTGAVSGRKEVGGIVGHMEPVTRVDFSVDTLQILQGQMDELAILVNKAVGHAQGNASHVGGQIGDLRAQAQTAKDAVGQLIPDAENPGLPDMDTILATQNTLSSTISAMPGTVDGIVSGLGSTVSTLSRDMGAISNQMELIGQTVNGIPETLGGGFSDVSDQDTEEERSGKIDECVNLGIVLGERNTGGIAGAMAFESDLDPEEDLQLSGNTSLNFDACLRAVILRCENRGAVIVKKQNAGGIVGWQFMGLVKDCVNTGALQAADASCVGGIAGRSSGYIRSTGTRCDVLGDTCVGGIAGSGAIVTDCRSMVRIHGSEQLGAVLGTIGDTYAREQTPISGNYYLAVESDLGGIDGISYEGLAEPLDQAAFLSLEALPEFFKTVTVSFMLDGEVLKTLQVNTGEGLEPSDIPELPERFGYVGAWEGLETFDLSAIRFNTVFRGVYTANRAAIQSGAVRDSGLPVLLVQGSFTGDAVLSAERYESYPPLEEKLLLVEAWRFAISTGETAYTARFLLPDNCTAENMTLLLHDSRGWNEITWTVEGSYLVFPLTSSADCFAIAELRPPVWPLYAAGGAVAGLTAALIWAVGRRKKRAGVPTPTA